MDRPMDAFLKAFEKVLPGDGRRWFRALLLLDADAVRLVEWGPEHVRATVQSESDPQVWYEVVGVAGRGWGCACGDATARGATCKHIRAVKTAYRTVRGSVRRG